MKLFIAPSNIHGNGLYTEETLQPFQVTPVNAPYDNKGNFPGKKGEKVSGPIGYVNHSYKANSRLVHLPTTKSYYLVPDQMIEAGSELTINYDLNPKGLKKAYEYNPPLV